MQVRNFPELVQLEGTLKHRSHWGSCRAELKYEESANGDMVQESARSDQKWRTGTGGCLARQLADVLRDLEEAREEPGVFAIFPLSCASRETVAPESGFQICAPPEIPGRNCSTIMNGKLK